MLGWLGWSDGKKRRRKGDLIDCRGGGGFDPFKIAPPPSTYTGRRR